jgi:Protein of unknown function (DUF3810)
LSARSGPRAFWPVALLPAGLVAQWAAALAPGAVEVVYARGLYRGIRWAHALFTGWIPFSVAEATAVMLAAALGWRVAKGLRRHGFRAFWARDGLRRRLARAGLRLVGAAGAVYLVFLAGWGLNYQRPALAGLAGLGPTGGTRKELAALSAELVDAANALRTAVAEDAGGLMRLPGGRRTALDAAHEGLRLASGRLGPLAGPKIRPKPALSSPALSRLGISGIFIPFTGEAHVNTTLPDVDVPFAASHELAHQRGLAREDEANYAAAVACRLHPWPEFRYSGALLSSLYVQSALAGVDRDRAVALEARRTPAVRRDQAALAEWSRRYRSRLTDVSHRVNDTYLRSQGQELGVLSYGAMVDLLLAERRAAWREAGGEQGGTRVARDAVACCF